MANQEQPTKHSRRWFLATAGVAGLVAACSEKRPTLVTDTTTPSDPITTTPTVAPTGDPTTTAPDTTEPPATTSTVPRELLDVSLVATALPSMVDVYADPDDREPTWSFANPIETGGDLVFLLRDLGEVWHRVMLPVRPNGTEGWVRADDVALSRHNYRIEVMLADFDFKVFDHGDLIFQTQCAVARDNAPTPGGKYYTTELIRPIVPNSVYGTLAYGLSGFSEVFESFNGGPGQLGIHGTNDPDSIGTAASSGCIRLTNEDVEAIGEYLPLGVPVTVIA